MTEDRPHASVATYLKVAAILAIITALEFGVIYIRRLAPIVVPLLLVMSAAKFALVALFFMHLRYEGRSVTTLFVGPLLIAIGFVVAMISLRGAFLVFAR
ncbi:MAG TPA: cytochrome C oxidase subunit IV family protein [Calidithermus sp.]|jgi:cytochrome c oxidase subunit 4|nr:cytochrome C oxidase subunit IV family protein [Calidithermus sp.]